MKKKRTLEPKYQSAKKELGPKKKKEFIERTKKTKGKKRKRNLPSNRSGFLELRGKFRISCVFFNETYLLMFHSFFCRDSFQLRKDLRRKKN